MDKAQYKAVIKLLSNPDTAADGLVQLNDLVEVDTTAFEAAQLERTNLNNTLTELRQLNGKLSLRITEGTPGSNGAGSEEEKSDYDAFAEKFKGEESK